MTRQPTAADELAAQVRAALDALADNDPNTIRMPAILAVHNNAETWLRALLDERDQLQAVVDAARECADMLVFGLDERTFGHAAERAVQVRERLRDVLRKLDGEE